MTAVEWPDFGEDLGGLQARAYVDARFDELSAQIAALTSGVGNMRNEDNLAGLLDYVVARAYLDVFSKAETDTAIANAIAAIEP